MNRTTSFFWVSDDAPTAGDESSGLFLDDDEEASSDESRLLRKGPDYGMTRRRILPTHIEEEGVASIRFQVVVWHVGEVDVRLGHVPMKFRVTMFWNDMGEEENAANQQHPQHQPFVWRMQGREHACRQQMDTTFIEQVDVPPLSILNAVSFDAIGMPEVCLVREDTRLMRWTCMYNAVLLQKNMRVDKFPHDRHELMIRLAILANRHKGRKWDKSKWKLKLASETDSQGSTSIPHGHLVDHIHIPGFKYKRNTLKFEFVPHSFGHAGTKKTDHCLQVSLTVLRESGHYDTNIMPLMGLLNIVAISCLPRNFAPSTASTELMLSIAFVEIGFRLFIDSSLPSVGYQIKIQRILNQCFWLLMLLVLESNSMYFLVEFFGWTPADTFWYDCVTAFLAFMVTVSMLYWYYSDIPKL